MKSRFKDKFCPNAMGICRLDNCVYYWTDGTKESCLKVASVSAIMGIGKAVRESIAVILGYIQGK